MQQHQLQFRAHNGILSSCKLTIYPDIQLVIVSETDEGSSVTNSAEIIATEVVKCYGIDPSRMVFVEHYPAAQRPQFRGESYDLVTFTWEGNIATKPNWQPISMAELDALRASGITCPDPWKRPAT